MGWAAFWAMFSQTHLDGLLKTYYQQKVEVISVPTNFSM
jgi:hypothetical protein